jgi:uncharacterized membrane protein
VSGKNHSEFQETESDETDVEELVDQLEDIENVVDTQEQRRVVRQTSRVLDRLSDRRVFGLDDLAQQVVGGVVLSAPFIVTEEVWDLAASMNWIQWLITVLIVFIIGYGALYRADTERDPDLEESIAGLPIRFVSLILISSLSATMLAFLFDAPTTFGATPWSTTKAISVGAIFSVVGAATADSLFGE